MELELSEFVTGDVVLLHGPTPAFFGRHGTVERIGRKYLHVRLHLNDQIYNITPQWVTSIVEGADCGYGMK